MLQNIRENAQGTIAKGIIAVLIISLSVWGLDAIVGGGGEPAVASVDGEDITEREFRRMVQIERQQRLSQMDQPDPARIDDSELNESVLEALIQQKLLGRDVAARGLQLSEQEIDRMITEAPEFQVDGRFNRDRFMQIVRNQGMTVDQFRDMLERDHLTRVMQAVIQGSAFTTDDEVRRLAALLTQTRSFSALTVSLDQAPADVEVTDEEIERFYEENRTLFRQEEAADVSWITLRRQDLIDEGEVSDEDLRELYERRVSQQEQAQQRNAAHILIRDEDDAAERIAALEEALERGEDFADLASEYSDDTGTANDGGELGYSRFDDFEEAFSEALFEIEEAGSVVGPVETRFGTHFIKLLSVRAEDPPSMAELEDELRREIAEQQAGRRYVEMSERLADLAYAEYDLEAPAELIGQSIQERDGVTPERNESPFDHPQLLRQLFSEDVLEGGFNTELVEITPEEAVVARVREYYPETQRSLDEVRDEVRERVAERKRREQLSEQLSQFAERLRSEGPEARDEIASELGLEWERFENIERGDLHLPAILRDAAFRLPAPTDERATVDLVELPGSLALVSVDEVIAADEQTISQVAVQLRNSLAQRHGQMAYNYYLSQLREEASVNRR